jgi:hypothetical protein
MLFRMRIYVLDLTQSSPLHAVGHGDIAIYVLTYKTNPSGGDLNIMVDSSFRSYQDSFPCTSILLRI